MLRKKFSSELGRGAAILFITLNVFNLLNFLFHFVMARLLGPSDYGVLAVLMSIIYIYNVPTEAIQTLISRYTSKFNLRKENGKIKYLLMHSLKRGFWRMALPLFLVSAIIALLISSFLKINFWLIILTNLFLFYAVLGPVPKGVLQGRKKFAKLGSNFIIETSIRLAVSIALVLMGFGVFGAMYGVIFSVLIGFIFSLYFNKDIMNSKEKTENLSGIYKQSIPYFVSMLAIFLMLSMDIIFAKRFFSPEIAGKYAVLSMLGKMIFFGTVAISKIMFPLASERHDSNKDSLNMFKKSFLIVVSICLIVIAIYALFPTLIISLLYGSEYLEMSNYLVWSAVALSFLALSNLNLIYALSTDKMKKPYYLFLFLVIGGVLFYFFHNSILEYILAFMVSNIVMFIGTLFFLKR
ncbi:MAG: oligosaccharide flippase family protein [Nanoarchaeota archaeon]|nr:oligosaccharide flippase family protein [Nanoarchaeota archaeon]